MTIWILVLIAVGGGYNVAGQSTVCSPSTSAVDVKMKTMNNRLCFFPFIYDNVTYTDCAGASAGRRWCATTCNFERDYQFGICRWERKNLEVDSCQNLSDSQQYSTPETRTGARCSFPFVFKNKCYNGCTNEESQNLWCGTTSSVDLYPNSFDQCWYTREILSTPECANVSAVQRYRFPETTGSMCVFPFINSGACTNECILGADNKWFCGTDKVYNGTNWAYCKFLFNVQQYGSILKHGLYYISADCTYSPFCRGTVASLSNGNNSLLFLVQDLAPYQVTTWEVIPQPDSTVIIRVPLSQTSQSNLQPAWSISSSSLIILKTLDLYKENIRFTLTSSGKQDVFSLSKTVDTTVTATSMVGFQARTNDTRRFVPLEDVPVKQYWRFTLIQPFNKDDLKDTGIPATFATTTGSTTIGSTTTGSTTSRSTTTGSTTTGSTTTGVTTIMSTTTGSTNNGSTTTRSSTTGSTTTGSITTGSTTTGSTTTGSTTTGTTTIRTNITTRNPSGLDTTGSATKDTKPITVAPGTSDTNVSTEKLIDRMNILQVIICITLAVVAVDLIVTITSIVFLVRKI